MVCCCNLKPLTKLETRVESAGFELLKLKYDKRLSKFFFQFVLAAPVQRGHRVHHPAGVFGDHRGGRRGQRVVGRGSHSSTFQLNVSAFCGIGVSFRGCKGGVKQVTGGIRGFIGCILCKKRLRLS